MSLCETLAKKFGTSEQVINNIRSYHFGGKDKLQTTQLFASKIAKDVKKKSFRYPMREKTFLFLKNLTDEQYNEIISPPPTDSRFSAIRNILLEMIGGDIMIHSQPPTLEEFLAYHKEWRLGRIADGKNKFHEEKRIKEYQDFPEKVEEELRNAFNILTS